ncbi:carbohydrate ABC transporter permease [Paenibacillus sacheonensis]|uniref:ABC transporter permease subunit n=1 Tax=Paenibacillus sacheonensis TaxID=742054 RepID=A0A7X4YTA3_9BACL|nr:carbohydrate ABC transporter permease [Paenibacillus sacheonensis]MBM7568475.1 raffinose/stachyose/melibiose transport system permease protein [Paenibacillus sacheonensis]NBC72173.1 ABC transporter permease subunit [Paenibacillus sacheonensis]
MRRTSSKSSRGGTILLELGLWVAALIVLIPFYYLIINTLKPPADVVARPMSFDLKSLSFGAYTKAFHDMKYGHVFLNNLITTAGAVILIVLIGSSAAYTLVRRNTKFHRLVYYLFISSIIVPFQMAIVPLFKIFVKMHLMNTLLGVILVFVFTNIAFVVFLYYSFIRTIPYQLEEAAKIDGASVFRTFVSICFPLLWPVTGTVIIIQSVAFWNDFFVQILFIVSPKYFTITRMIYANVGIFSTDWSALLPMFVLGMLPILIFYVFMQKSIISGITAGSVKG